MTDHGQKLKGHNPPTSDLFAERRDDIIDKGL